ncbi:MAG: Sulfate permease [Burkholderia sp.]|nr:Sulfate permease [Burkholderia sp.]
MPHSSAVTRQGFSAGHANLTQADAPRKWQHTLCKPAQNADIPQTLHTLAVSAFSLDLLRELFAPALMIVHTGAIEFLLSAKVSDKLIDDRHDPNQELMAQGIANMVVPFFGGLRATGTIARTVSKIRSGASSPVAGMVRAAASSCAVPITSRVR